MLNTERTLISDKYMRYITRLHDDKVAINDTKRQYLPLFDTDDWGFIHYPDFTFTSPYSEREDGIVCGYVPIGKTLRKFFNEIPKYVNECSALAGAWIGLINNWVNISMPPEERPPELVPIWEKYCIQPGFGAMNHCGADMNIGFALGWGGILDKLRRYRALNNPADASFYNGEIELVLGIQEWVAALAVTATEKAVAETDPDLKRNLYEIAEMNRHLVSNPPRTFREACQFIAHFQSVDRTYFLGGALDQLDTLLEPFYERDVAAGILTDEVAVWCIASLLFNDTHYSQIAGLTPDGSRDTTNRVSFLVLDAMHALRIPVNMALRVHDDVNPELLRRSLEYNMEDGTGVSYSLNIGIEKGYAKNGYPEQLGRMRKKIGCNWCAIPGYEYPLQDVTRLNLGFALHYALEDLRDGERTLERLWEGFAYHVKVIVDSVKAGFDAHYEKVGHITPEIIYNLFMYGPVERGLNCSEGGVDILNFCMDGCGLATVADSFAAIEQRIVDEQRLSWDELYAAMDSNFEREEIRLMLRNIKRFGSPDSLAQKWAERVRDCFVGCCKDGGTPKHNLPVIPGMFSHGGVYQLGSKLPATPNGRRGGEEISHSNEPDPGFARGIDTFSPTLKATAVASVQPGYGNSSPLHLDIDTQLIHDAGGIDALIQLIHAHNHMGGTLINLNCLSRKILMEAHENPASHPDLVVRVTGYSAFFASLSKSYRQQIIDRFL